MGFDRQFNLDAPAPYLYLLRWQRHVEVEFLPLFRWLGVATAVIWATAGREFVRRNAQSLHPLILRTRHNPSPSVFKLLARDTATSPLTPSIAQPASSYPRLSASNSSSRRTGSDRCERSNAPTPRPGCIRSGWLRWAPCRSKNV